MPLFTTAEARAFDKGQLVDASTYPDLAITNKEAELREWFSRIFCCDFIPTSHTETLDGDGSDFIMLKWPLVTAVTAISIDGVAQDAAYLNATDYSIGLGIDSDKAIVTSRGLRFTAGWSNIVVTYTAGYTTPPARIKRAALNLCVSELQSSNLPSNAQSFDFEGVQVQFHADGFRGRWFNSDEGQAAYTAYSRLLPGIA